jgi:uncharacterized membrane protein YhaH (DUF805 family)
VFIRTWGTDWRMSGWWWLIALVAVVALAVAVHWGTTGAVVVAVGVLMAVAINAGRRSRTGRQSPAD